MILATADELPGGFIATNLLTVEAGAKDLRSHLSRLA